MRISRNVNELRSKAEIMLLTSPLQPICKLLWVASHLTTRVPLREATSLMSSLTVSRPVGMVLVTGNRVIGEEFREQATAVAAPATVKVDEAVAAGADILEEIVAVTNGDAVVDGALGGVVRVRELRLPQEASRK
jgi:hypothetical protein